MTVEQSMKSPKPKANKKKPAQSEAQAASANAERPAAEGSSDARKKKNFKKPETTAATQETSVQTPAPKVNPPAPKPAYKTEDEDQEFNIQPANYLPQRQTQYNFAVREGEATESLTIKLSGALHRKLQSQAADEGISIQDLTRELLAEAVVLRAWEIIEKKIQLRGGQPQMNQNNNMGGRNNNNNHRQGGGHRNKGGHRGGMSQMRYNSIMDDKASFLEYVRNQERNRR